MPAECPTLCDPECVVACHEWHHVPWKRDHDPVQCEQRYEDLPDPWARSEMTAPERSAHTA